MSKLAQGPATWHVLGSNGPSSNPLAFYSTTYSVHHGRHSKPSAEPATFRHKGTGYESNFRPAVFYSSKLDQLDNPAMGRLVKDNYNTHTHREYTGYPWCRGSEPLPGKVVPFFSGYASSASSRTIPPACQILLSATEYNTHFQHGPAQGVRRSRHSNKEESGFTHAHNVEPVTFRPHENHTGDLPGNVTWRPTGDSVMKKSFQRPSYLKGNEALESVCAQDQHGNGFVKGSKVLADVQPAPREMVGYTVASQVHPSVVERVRKRDPAEHSILTHPQHYTSYTQRSYGRASLVPVSEERAAVGAKELTGFSENNCPLLEPTEIQRYSTHYQSRFADPSGSVRENPGGCGVQPPANSGFCKGTVVHGFRQLTGPLRELPPYVARSAVKRDSCYDDHTHDGKKH